MNSSVICDVNEIYLISYIASYSHLYSRLYLYLLPLCNGTLFTWAVGGMIHPVICDRGEILIHICSCYKIHIYIVFLFEIRLFVFAFVFQLVFASSLQRYNFYTAGRRNDPSCDL